MALVRYLFRRVLLSVLVVIGVAFLVFVASQIVPSDPATLYAGPRPTADQVEAARLALGLDQPLWTRFVTFLGNMLTGDFGISYKTRHLISEDLRAFLPATLELALVSNILALAIGVPVGVAAAARPGSALDRAVGFGAIMSVAMPSFFLAIVLQGVFALGLDILPLSGRISREIALTDPIDSVTGFLLIDTLLAGRPAAFGDALAHLILPALTLASYPAGITARLTRSAMVEILRQPYVTSASALGLPRRRILFGHALPNAAAPTLTVVGLSFAYALTGAVLVEIIFAWPGLGRYVSEAVLSRDFPVITATTFVVTICYVTMNLIIDVAQATIDPRIALS